MVGRLGERIKETVDGLVASESVGAIVDPVVEIHLLWVSTGASGYDCEMVTTSDANSSSATLSELTTQLEQRGYGGQFGVVDADEVRCFSCRATQLARDLSVEEISRTEGTSDPDDMAAVAAVTCSVCGVRGTLVLKYGPASDPDDAEVLRLL